MANTKPTYKSIQFGGLLAKTEDNSSKSSSGSAQSTPTYRQQYRTYPWRWFMLASLVLLNISNGMMWLTFAPIPNYTARYYNITVSDVDWFSISYFIVSLLMGLVSIYVLDTAGLKVSLYAGATFNIVGALLRLVSTIEPIVCSSVFGKSGFMVALIGQILTACAQPFLLYAPTTLAAVWFGPKERAICTNFASVSNPLGLAIVQIASPYIVTSVSRLPMMLWIYAIPAGVSFFLVMVAFWRKEPPNPPAPSGERDHVPPFFKGILHTLKNWSFWVLLVIWGGGAGLVNAFITLLPQILCPYGYTDEQSGLWGALMIIFGVVGATVAGVAIDMTKKYKMVTVISMALALLSIIWFYIATRFDYQPLNIAFSLCVFGFFALPLIPACMELGVEITYPVAEATSSGLLWSGAQIMGIILVFVCQVLQTPLSPYLIPRNQCASSNGNKLNETDSLPKCFSSPPNSSLPTPLSDSTPLYDFEHGVIFFISLVFVLYVLLVFVFRPKYRRVDSEKKASFEQSMFVGSTPTNSTTISRKNR